MPKSVVVSFRSYFFLRSGFSDDATAVDSRIQDVVLDFFLCDLLTGVGHTCVLRL